MATFRGAQIIWRAPFFDLRPLTGISPEVYRDSLVLFPIFERVRRHLESDQHP